MLSSSVLLVAFASIATAFNSTDANYPYTIPAGSVPLTTSQPWCTAQRNSCGSICGGQAYPNDCDPMALTYNCVCSTMSTPNITQYTQTLPYFTCQQYIANCVASTNSAAVQKQCMSIQCGSMDSTRAATGGAAASSGSASSTAAGAGAAASSGGASVASGASSAAGTATSAAGSATSAVRSAASSVASAVASATPTHNAAATAGIGMLGAAVAGMIAFVA